MEMVWNCDTIYFAILVVLVAFLPTLIYNFCKNLIHAIPEGKNQSNGYCQKIRRFYRFTNAVVFPATIFGFFCIFIGLMVKMPKMNAPHLSVLIIISFIAYAIVIIITLIIGFCQSQFGMKYLVLLLILYVAVPSFVLGIFFDYCFDELAISLMIVVFAYIFIWFSVGGFLFPIDALWNLKLAQVNPNSPSCRNILYKKYCNCATAVKKTFKITMLIYKTIK